MGGWARGEDSIYHRASSWLQQHLHTSLPCPLPPGPGRFLPVSSLPPPTPLRRVPHLRHGHGVGVGWGEASLSCLKDGGAGEAGLGAQTAACVGGDVLRCPPPGSPRSDVWCPPLSPPGLVAAWPDSPGLLPPPCLLPTPGQGATLPEGHCACPGKGLWGGERAAGWE